MTVQTRANEERPIVSPSGNAKDPQLPQRRYRRNRRAHVLDGVLSGLPATIPPMPSLAVDFARAPSSNLPAPASLSPANAMTLASELISADVLDLAVPYLAYALTARPTAFGLCRLGRLYQRRGDVRDAVGAYEAALALEPDNAWALVGRASALAECFDATLPELVGAAEPLPRVASGAHRRPAVFALRDLVRAALRERPSDALQAAAAALSALARSMPRDAAPGETSAFQERLLAALSVLAELARAPSIAGLGPVAGARTDVRRLCDEPSRRQLPPPDARADNP